MSVDGDDYRMATGLFTLAKNAILVAIALGLLLAIISIISGCQPMQVKSLADTGAVTVPVSLCGLTEGTLAGCSLIGRQLPPLGQPPYPLCVATGSVTTTDPTCWRQAEARGQAGLR